MTLRTNERGGVKNGERQGNLRSTAVYAEGVREEEEGKNGPRLIVIVRDTDKAGGEAELLLSLKKSKAREGGAHTRVARQDEQSHSTRLIEVYAVQRGTDVDASSVSYGKSASSGLQLIRSRSDASVPGQRKVMKLSGQKRTLPGGSAREICKIQRFAEHGRRRITLNPRKCTYIYLLHVTQSPRSRAMRAIITRVPSSFEALA